MQFECFLSYWRQLRNLKNVKNLHSCNTVINEFLTLFSDDVNNMPMDRLVHDSCYNSVYGVCCSPSHHFVCSTGKNSMKK